MQSVIYEGEEKDLLHKPAHVYDDKHPRGGPTGWGIYSYSYPDGPKRIEEVHR